MFSATAKAASRQREAKQTRAVFSSAAVMVLKCRVPAVECRRWNHVMAWWKVPPKNFAAPTTGRIT